MIILGLTGNIGSGKTTFADFLSEQVERSGHWESWQLIAEVANGLRSSGVAHPDPRDLDAINAWLRPLPGLITEICHKKSVYEDVRLHAGAVKTAPQLYEKLFAYLKLMQARPELRGVAITDEVKEELRSILQWIGGYLPTIYGGDIWYAEIIRRIQASDGLELATIGGVRYVADAKCIKTAGGRIALIVRPGLEARDGQDPTERERSDIAIDITVYNDGRLDELESCAEQLAHDLLDASPATVYRARQA